ncbi:hypothetical protein BC826DRAFT_1187953 [Russula brevipes]|nr:hypothetical protein BC826DRAFT_1187953 [Russula brevipes]
MSKNKFTAIFDTALSEHKKLTGQDPCEHPLAAELATCRNPEDVSNLLQTHAVNFRKSRDRHRKLMQWLNPTVHILFTFSETLEDMGLIPFSPARIIFTGIGVLLEVSPSPYPILHPRTSNIRDQVVRDDLASHDTLIQLFERIHYLLRRLECLTSTLLTNELTELLGKTMAQLLSILSLSTKTMTDGRIKKFVKRLLGKAHPEDAVSQLDMLTKEDNVMGVAKSLEILHEIKRNQLRENIRRWLSPPNPTFNHDAARETQHSGTARWFIEGRTFREWKNNCSLLCIRGDPGSGKTILCSAIIEDIKNMGISGPALVAYYYFDFNDVSKRDIRGLLASILFQLSDDSDHCWDVLHALYSASDDGFEQPSDADLAKCLKAMLEVPGQLPPSLSSTLLTSVLVIMEPHLPAKWFWTFRPEPDIQSALDPLTSASFCVSLHEESGQKEDIISYICSFVHHDNAMRRWKEDDKELVIDTLSERAETFRWVVCQLDTLRLCFPSSIRKTLNGLPATLHETYKRTLAEIPEEKRRYTRRLFQCLVAAIRPLRVEELAEIFAIEFDQDTTSNFKEGWRPENPEEAVLSACSTLITVTEDEGCKIVQFSHFSVKEFLTSDRLRTSSSAITRHYYIPLDAAHIMLARACLTVLLQLDEKVDKKRLATFPLAFYAAQHWVDHVKYEDVASRVQDVMERLFDPDESHLTAWAWIYDVERGQARDSIDALPESPTPCDATALYCAVLCGFSRLAEHLIVAHTEYVNAKCGRHGTALHAASYMGHLDAARVLLHHGAHVNMKNENGRTPLWVAYNGGHLEVMRLLLGHGANGDVIHDSFGRLLHDASHKGQAEATQLLLQHDADVDARGYEDRTPLHWASTSGHAKVAQLLLEYGADVNSLSMTEHTPLYLASLLGHLEVVEVLLKHGADVSIRGGYQTPLQAASDAEVVQLLLKHGAYRE